MGLYDTFTSPMRPDMTEPRPEKFDLSALFKGFETTYGEEVAPVDSSRMGTFLQMIMNLESYGGYNMSQTTGGPGEGVFQLETGEGQGGWTRLNRAMLNLPRNLTPDKLAREWEISGYRTAEKGKTGSFDASRFNTQEQIYLMAANIMLDEGGRYEFDTWAKSGSKEDFLDWWLEYHWGGPESERLEKKRQVMKIL